MLALVLLLHLTVPAIIAQSVDQTLASDSTAAATELLVPYRSEIEVAARKESLPASLIAAVIQEESRFDPWATRAEARYLRSRTVRREAALFVRRHPGPTALTELVDRSRSYGLMQVMGETAREQGFARPFLAELYVPSQAIEHGAELLARLLRRYHNDTLASISAYNQGTARTLKRGAHHTAVFANARYVYRVAIAWRAYRRIFAEGAHTP